MNPRQLKPGMRVAAYLDGAAPGRFELAVAGQGELSACAAGIAANVNPRTARRRAASFSIVRLPKKKMCAATLASRGVRRNRRLSGAQKYMMKNTAATTQRQAAA